MITLGMILRAKMMLDCKVVVYTGAEATLVLRNEFLWMTCCWCLYFLLGKESDDNAVSKELVSLCLTERMMLLARLMNDAEVNVKLNE